MNRNEVISVQHEVQFVVREENVQIKMLKFVWKEI